MNGAPAVLLMALAGVLLGGAYSLRQQGLPRWTWICMLLLAGLSLVAAYLVIPS
ncbi:hypothetical protein [Falsarthrobacter nasiphocae]|uniref:Uncharacterized protein n=1 Tax=Falsarthrobacter nasiphocae TaxID=189863 RepID=A0AAE4C5V4_9MICC|nr:hypothetical protein [Falsarthrobacter nasiphocae]MDR6892686.1 hypothetical protein [Falsarthrobacter nasiphocae]